MNPQEAREVLANRNRGSHISGMGKKAASHFLRGLGFSHNQLAILDSRISGWLLKFGVIEEVPKNLPNKRYLEIEKKMKDWQSREITDIPMDALDWLLWKMKDC
jgi:thermostable 8-oxoguanine DNA glycosylase